MVQCDVPVGRPRRGLPLGQAGDPVPAGLRRVSGVGQVHDEEHGLWMTEGAGTYVLGRDEHEVQADDFIYMAPYCPQGFTASAAGPAEYLLYKDVWRDGF